LLDRDFATGSNAKLSVGYYLFSGCDTFLDDDQIALSLAQRNLPMLSGRVRFHYDNVRTIG